MANSTPNLGIAHIASNQSQKEVTANTAFDELDEAMTQYTTVDVSGNTDVTPASATISLGFSFQLAGTLTGNINLIVPTAMKFFQFYHNAIHPSVGSYSVTIKTSAGTGVKLEPGDKRLLYCDGTNVVDLLNVLTTPRWQEYTVATLPAGIEGQYAYATDGLKLTDNPSVGGTGVPVYYSNGAWRVFSTDAEVTA
jgi:hypothetical protein